MAVTSVNETNGDTYMSLIASLLHEFEASDRTKRSCRPVVVVRSSPRSLM